jgi:hypothetical protein
MKKQRCWRLMLLDGPEWIYLFIYTCSSSMLFPHAKSELSSLSLILLCGRRWCLLLCESTSASPYKRGAYIRIKLEEAASQPELIRFGRKGTQHREVNLMQSMFTCTHSGKYVNNLRSWSIPFWCENVKLCFDDCSQHYEGGSAWCNIKKETKNLRCNTVSEIKLYLCMKLVLNQHQESSISLSQVHVKHCIKIFKRIH